MSDAILELSFDESLKEIVRLEAEVDRLRALLREARQYVSDAGNDEDFETVMHAAALLSDIDAALEQK